MIYLSSRVLLNNIMKNNFFEEFKTASAIKTQGQIKYAMRRAKAIIEKAGDKFWKGYNKPTDLYEQRLFVATGILGRSPFLRKIRLTHLDGNEIERELARARTYNLAQSTKDLSDEIVKDKDGKTMILITPYRAFKAWERGEITTTAYIDLINVWKKNSKVANSKERYAD